MLRKIWKVFWGIVDIALCIIGIISVVLVIFRMYPSTYETAKNIWAKFPLSYMFRKGSIGSQAIQSGPVVSFFNNLGEIIDRCVTK